MLDTIIPAPSRSDQRKLFPPDHPQRAKLLILDLWELLLKDERGAGYIYLDPELTLVVGDELNAIMGAEIFKRSTDDDAEETDAELSERASQSLAGIYAQFPNESPDRDRRLSEWAEVYADELVTRLSKAAE